MWSAAHFERCPCPLTRSFCPPFLLAYTIGIDPWKLCLHAWCAQDHFPDVCSGAGKGRRKAVGEVIRQERRGKLPLWERGPGGGDVLTAAGEAVKEGGEALEALRATFPEHRVAMADAEQGKDAVEGEKEVDGDEDRLLSEDEELEAEAEAAAAMEVEVASLEKGTIVLVPATEFSLPHGSFVRRFHGSNPKRHSSHGHRIYPTSL